MASSEPALRGSDESRGDTNRLANAFGFEVMSPEGFQAGARYLLRRGYR